MTLPEDTLISVINTAKTTEHHYYMDMCEAACSVHPTRPYTGELGYDRLNWTRKIGPSYAKSVIYI